MVGGLWQEGAPQLHLHVCIPILIQQMMVWPSSPPPFACAGPPLPSLLQPRLPCPAPDGGRSGSFGAAPVAALHGAGAVCAVCGRGQAVAQQLRGAAVRCKWGVWGVNK